jgi:hypothetical protein
MTKIKIDDFKRWFAQIEEQVKADKALEKIEK